MTDIVHNSKRITHIRVEPRWGSHFIISEMHSGRRPTIWIDVDVNDSGVAIGNKISDAIERAFGLRLFGYGLPVGYCLSRLAKASTELGEFILVVSGEPAQDITMEDVYKISSRIILCGPGHEVPAQYGFETTVVGERDLTLTLEDVEGIALDRCSASHVDQLLAESHGRFEDFMVTFQASLGLPPPERPYPDRFAALSSDLARPSELIDAHVRRGYWIEAFEVAVRSAPDRIVDLIENAAEQYRDKGLLDRLTAQIELIDIKHWHDEPVAYWILTAAISTNTHRSLIPRIKQNVDVESMPDLRALLAIQDLTPSSLSETREAYLCKQSLVTTRAHAFSLSQFGQPEEGLKLLMSALREAQLREKGRELVSIGSDIAHAHALLGEYQAALAWGEWALAGFEKYQINEELLLWYVKSQVQYVRLLTSDGPVQPTLNPEIAELDLAGIPTFEAVISTLGDYEFVNARYEAALKLYERNREAQSREQAGHFSLDICRALLAMGRASDALEIAEGAIGLSAGTNELNQLKARVAKAICVSSVDPGASRDVLAECLDASVNSSQWDIAAICSIALANSWLCSGARQSAGLALIQGTKGLKFLGVSGWRLFGGWHKHYSATVELWQVTQNPTVVSLLGHGRLTRDGEGERLQLRNAEILTLLTLYPEGLTGEQLSEKLYEQERSNSTLKASLSRLRNVISIESQPYRIAEFVKTDLHELESLLRSGRVSEALFAYSEPLLPESDAPGIVAYREFLDEAVRQAALVSTDVDSVFEYAQRRSSDLEVWEALLKIVGDSDVRTSFIRARVLKLREDWGFSRSSA